MLSSSAQFLLTLIIIISTPPIILILRLLRRYVTDLQTVVIPRHQDSTLIPNPLFHKSLSYLSSLPILESSDRILIFSSSRKHNEFHFQPDPKRTTLIDDRFHGARLRWSLNESELTLTFRRKDRARVLRPYLQHVEFIGDDSKRKDLKLHSLTYTNGTKIGWNSDQLSHPATFDTVFMDPDLKTKIKNDLELFSKGRSFYTHIGKVWKRSYVLNGQSCTEKSSFVAAMAKFLNYDIFDFDLSKLENTCEVKSLFLQTSPKSIILVEKFENYTNNEMLDFTKGMFSSCGEERLFVYTTNMEKEEEIKRIECDVEIYFPLCDFMMFKSMASSYLGLKDHKLYSQVKEGFERGGRISVDEVGEIMISSRGSSSRVIKNVINALHKSLPPLQLDNYDNEVSRVASSDRFGKEATVKEIKKLYGLIRRNGSKKDGVMSVEVAAAAAAAGSGGGGYESCGKESGR